MSHLVTQVFMKLRPFVLALAFLSARSRLCVTCHTIKILCIHPIKCNFHTILRANSNYFSKYVINRRVCVVRLADVCCWVAADWFVYCCS